MANDKASSAAAETQAFAQLLQRKPPAKLDGLLNLVTDLKKGSYSKEEQKVMAESIPGRTLAVALRKCEGLKQKAREASTLEDREKARRLAKESSIKYLDCLAYATCQDRWKQYTQCWTSLSGLSSEQLRYLQRVGLGVACVQERHALERCVGGLVSETVRSSDETYSHGTTMDDLVNFEDADPTRI